MVLRHSRFAVCFQTSSHGALLACVIAFARIPSVRCRSNLHALGLGQVGLRDCLNAVAVAHGLCMRCLQAAAVKEDPQAARSGRSWPAGRCAVAWKPSQGSTGSTQGSQPVAAWYTAAA
jgi:hypothetical protein